MPPRPTLRKPIQSSRQFADYFEIGQQTRERLETYADLLALWQRKINLVAPKTIDEMWHRHFTDSAQLLDLVDEVPTSWVDAGSGAGFPALVVAILLTDPKYQDANLSEDVSRETICKTSFTLVESDSRKAAFLREVARQAGIPVDICNNRIEISTTQDAIRGKDVYSARAFAPLSRMFRDVAPVFSASSIGLFPKGRTIAEEITEAQKLWKFDVQLVESVTDADGKIAIVTNLNAKNGGANP